METAGRTGFDARGLEADRDPVDAQRALGHLAGRLGEAGNVEGAAGLAVLAADAIVRVDVDDAIVVLDDRARRGTGCQAARLVAVHALILAHEPGESAVEVPFVEADQVPVLGLEGW